MAAEKPINNTLWAVWIIILGALLALVLPWTLTHLYSGVNFAAKDPIGDTIGGIAGPVLNFAGLLVVYFSLREQFTSNQIQIQNFTKEQHRSANESTINTAFKLIDDLRTEARRIQDQLPLRGYDLTEMTGYIDHDKFPDFSEVNYEKEPQLLQYQATFEEAASSEGYSFQRLVLDYFQSVATQTKVLRATVSMFFYLLNNSQLPPAQRIHLYHIVLAFYEPLVINLLGGLEIFSHYRKPIDELVQQAWILQQDMRNSYEAFSDLAEHDPNDERLSH
ncbi:hypothetical protein [Hymenobacter cavernae]|uniref:DUF4239 domain-containing protein n=1 Tax=Hymenobacter cavernae TaxID=2044852 RepID=A0ABQ1UWD8_9BACT|nr:hypothetical protein [Hymenobacter cavernae]GGF27455.1 hypothetical protein GCM10011383_43920 [Hymenobacter cavernae]